MFPHAVDVIVKTDGPSGRNGSHPPPPDVLRDPKKLFRRYLKDRDIQGDDLVELFDELLEEVYASASA